MSVTVILNGYKRPHALTEQYDAVVNQSYKDINVMFWNNGDPSAFPFDVINKCTSALCNQNLGVWARFAYALMAKDDLICMLDDDTIPGSGWIEHCVDTMNQKEGLIGGRGVRFVDNTYISYPSCNYEGVGRGNTEIKRVDIVGHSWFFKREWLSCYWAEMPKKLLSHGGEDMHLSYVLQDWLGLYSYIPPQPEDQPHLWASINPSKYGEDMQATSRTFDGLNHANIHWNYILRKGYKLAKDEECYS